MIEQVTFLLALVGYAGLTFTAVRSALGTLPRGLWRGVVLVIVLHVLLVWTVRYEWRLGEATRNGFGGFVLFHGALIAILASTVLSERVARVLIWAAFFVVSAGVIGATLRYDVVAVYRIPVLLVALVGLVGLTIALRRRRPGLVPAD
ncbi:MAG: hypothetical protein ACT4P7_12380 [Gemmatimonadaceae bacterium]